MLSDSWWGVGELQGASPLSLLWLHPGLVQNSKITPYLHQPNIHHISEACTYVEEGALNFHFGIGLGVRPKELNRGACERITGKWGTLSMLSELFSTQCCHVNWIWKKYTSGPRYWNVPVLVNTGTFLVYQYCPKMCYLRSLEHASVIRKLTILEHKNGLVLSNTHVPVSGTWSILFPWI